MLPREMSPEAVGFAMTKAKPRKRKSLPITSLDLARVEEEIQQVNKRLQHLLEAVGDLRSRIE